MVDFVGGLEDLQKRQLRTIGAPDIRFREDPVRILRAIKFAARLELEIDPATHDAMVKYREQIRFCPSARVLEELTRFLNEGTSRRAMDLANSVSALQTLLPEISDCLQNPVQAGRLRNRLRAADEMVLAGQTLTRPVALANLYYETLKPDWTHSQDIGRYLDLGRIDHACLPMCATSGPRPGGLAESSIGNPGRRCCQQAAPVAETPRARGDRQVCRA